MRRWIFLPLLALALFAGTAVAGKREKMLDSTLAEYAATLRWGNFEAGMAYIDPALIAERPVSSLELERYRQVRVSYYHPQDPVPVGKEQVRVVAEIGVVNEHSQSERVVIDRQLWRWDAKAKRWWLMSGLPDITRKDR
ncbi:MAG TPA: hypothetical protein VM555_04450 [Tahibacter sp.]|nr:hypothetical protein [Tahibacter sp.]